MQLSYLVQSNVQCPPWKEACGTLLQLTSVWTPEDCKKFLLHTFCQTCIHLLCNVAFSYHGVISILFGQMPYSAVNWQDGIKYSRMLPPCDGVRQLRNTCERVQSGLWAATLTVCRDQLTRVTLAAGAVFVLSIWTAPKTIPWPVYQENSWGRRVLIRWMLVSWNFYSMQNLFHTSAE